MGLPVVVSDVDRATEMVLPGETSLLGYTGISTRKSPNCHSYCGPIKLGVSRANSLDRFYHSLSIEG
ncbi:hypothetical protein IVB22_03890 [Bradyrhizobium sp. 190]|nr:hypothetical protein [Bradyrhizobium sp. 190]